MWPLPFQTAGARERRSVGSGSLALRRPFSLTSTVVSGELTWIRVAVAAAAAVVCILAWIVVKKGRPLAAGDVFRASRLSRGNRLFPTQVLVSPSTVVQYSPRWIGRQEESIHITHVASVKIDTRLLLSDVLIETSGGASPILCHGHHKGDAVRMKALIERHQNDYYRSAGRPADGAPPASPGPTRGTAATGPSVSGR